MVAVKSAADFMRKKLITLAPESDVMDSVARMLKDNISGAPVVDAEGNYLGVFSEKCCMNALTHGVEVAHHAGLHLPRVREFMTCKLVTLTPEVDVFDAIDHILKRHISGAPVVDGAGKFLGIFSEKTAMQVLVAALHDRLPGTHVRSYMNTDQQRIVHEEDTLLHVAHRFQETPYRRLPALKGEKLVGQVSRRDVLRAEHRMVLDVISQSRKSSASDELKQAAEPRQVGPFMDCDAMTTTPNTDMLGIAQMFLHSPYRRLPIVEKGRLVGQVSRRDLLEAAAEVLRPKPQRRGAETLYLSGVAGSAPPSLG
ncbi:CBS domain-containing protein [Novipirellula artificiosorum]|uniref:Inosine 5'-monophosphate dehydrogenase n=1 Tax=Novipirellula artificiosorum TaxID=2528016 RepID=A0A5C6E421_9BACT|nr:CBS domain-containing protein [Novipirellula artificiosorum]TWU42331.1 inosine 5'-monophosphate dehydrogenase [Novipirellula artificiosorum]